MPAWPSSVRARLTLWYTVLVGLPLVALAVVCYVAFGRALLRNTDRFIGDALGAFAREVVAERRGDAPVEEALRVTAVEMRFRELTVVTVDSGWRLVASTGATAGSDTPPDLDQALVAALRERGRPGPVALTIRLHDEELRVVEQPLAIGDGAYTLVGSASLRPVRRTMQLIQRMFAVAIPLLLLFAATSGSFLAKRSLAPVGAMAARAAEISATTLHERLPVSGGDELVRLARVVNDLLDRLERSFEQQRRFMADASHELRTPTAVVRAEADITLSRAHRTETEYREAVAVMQDASRRLTRIVDDLFLLARADSGHQAVRLEPLYLDEVVEEAARAVRPLAARRGVRVQVEGQDGLSCRGDADLLGRLVLNLLDNAIKYSPPDGCVAVTLAREAGGYTLSVADQGEGIPLDLREHVFDRFFRADVARSREGATATSGAGLGLSIARWIAEAHGGRLELVGSRPGRTEFRLTLPIAA